MKILLIQPPVQDFYDTDIRLQPLGLCFLKAALAQYCPEVEVIIRDFHNGWGRQTIALPKELLYVKEYFNQPDTSPFSSFHQYYHFGLSFEKIGKEVAIHQPDLVGISSLFSPYYREIFSCAQAIKKRVFTKIVVGGGQATCCPELMLGCPHIDYIIQGEGEKPLVELVQTLQSNKTERFVTIAGLGYKNNDSQFLNPAGKNYPFEDLPPPELSGLSTEIYQYRNEPIAFVQSSRGCPHRCSFCSVHRIFGHKYRKRPPEKIIQEMNERYTQGYRVFDFEDDNLTLDKKHIIALCKLITKEFANRKISLLAMNGVSYQSLDWEILIHMQKAGFSRLNLALVSSAPQVLQRVNRDHCLKIFPEIIDQAFALGFDLEVHQILGLPSEQLDTMIDTLALLAGMPVLIGVSIFYLTPGAPIAAEFPEMNEEDIFKSRSTAMAIVSNDCTRGDLFTLFITARKKKGTGGALNLSIVLSVE